MGYYKGNGVITGGNESIAPFNSICFKDNTGVNNYYFLEQKTKNTTKVRRGVSLDDAMAGESTSSLKSKTLVYWWYSTSGGYHEQVWVLPSCHGTKKDVSYSRIGDSNLFELSETDTELRIRTKINDGGWGGWE